MSRSNFHTHTTYSDGHDSIEEMIGTAVEKGFSSLGFSDHSPMPFAVDWDMKQEDMDRYYGEIRSAQQVYGDRLALYGGIEMDGLSDRALASAYAYDYVISSVHFLKKGSEIYTVDLSAEEQWRMINDLCGGNKHELAKRYYDALLEHVSRTKTDIVGHFDLLTKFGLIENDDKYLRIATEALCEMARHCSTFELNTGAIARGLRTVPYPDVHLLREIKNLGGRVLISSDCHYRQKLDFWFDEAEQLLAGEGFTKKEKARLNDRVRGIEIWE